MTVARIVGLLVLVLLLVVVISQPENSAATARSGGRALGSVGSSLGAFVASVTSGTSTAGSSRDASYVVRPGDTLSSIATIHGTRVSTLAAVNDIADPDLIRPGQELSLR